MTELDDELDKEYFKGKIHLAIAYSKLFCQSDSIFKCYQKDSTAKDKCPECRKIETAMAVSDFT